MIKRARRTRPQGRPVHFPADPNKFVFDKDVAAIFDDMAERSIPLFRQTHQLHARMVAARAGKSGSETIKVLDAGASRGAFIRALVREVGTRKLDIVATDISESMCSYLREDYPWVTTLQCDLTDPSWPEEMEEGAFDVLVLNYVLQFIHPDKQMEVLRRLLRCVKVGGVVVYGHKESVEGDFAEELHDQYIRFRVDNGYSLEEITAKTEALKRSMFPLTLKKLKHGFHTSGFGAPVETSRYTVFSTYMAVKQED